MKKLVAIVLCLAMTLTVCNIDQTNVEAKATKKAMKFLKGTWVTAGNSAGTKVIFTKKYVKYYDLFTSDGKVKSPKSKGKYTGKYKIVSTKKKGKKWTIKVKSKNGYIYYKGNSSGLIFWWKENGEWMMSASSSIERVSRKVYK